MQKHHRPEPAPEGAVSFSLGSERIGLVPLHFRWQSLLAVLAISILAAFGVSRITVDDSLTELFRADTADFRQYEKLSNRFPSSEYDVLVVIEGPTLLERNSLDALRNTVIDMQFVEGSRGIISIFSARASPEPGKLPAPLVPEPLPEGPVLDRKSVV